MRYGLALPNGGACGDPRTLAELAALAEQAGWDAVFLEDYIVWQGKLGVPTCDPWVALAGMAVRTERIRLGTSVTPLPRRRPWKLAREAVTLDYLSNGRAILGIGLGDSQDASFTHFGEVTDAKQRAAILDEGLDVLEGLWSGLPFQYSGKHFRVDEINLSPEAIQRPRIPIWIGGSWPRQALTRRAARCDGICPYIATPDWSWVHFTPQQLRDLKADVERLRTLETPFDIVIGGTSRHADWDAERTRLRALADAGATWSSEYVEPAPLEEMRAEIARGPLRIE